MDEFFIGQIFENEYPENVALWCNEQGNCYITELESVDGIRTFQIVAIPEKTDEEKAQEEAERIAKLFLRRGDVFRGILQAKGVTKAQIGAMIEAMPETTQEEILAKELARIDFEDAIEFYRGNPLVDTIGLTFGITSEQLDKFFETNDYTTLL